MHGHVVYLYAYDVAYEIQLDHLRTVFAERTKNHEPIFDKTDHRSFPFYKPLYIQQSPLIVPSIEGQVRIYPEVKIFSFGVISIAIQLEFKARSLKEILKYHTLKLDGGNTIDDVASEVCEQMLSRVSPYLVKANSNIGNPETYTIFWLDDIDPGPATVQEWLSIHRREVAGLLTEESNFDKLSEDEIVETNRHNYSYTTDDLLVIDWNSALIIDPNGKPDELLYIIEVANVQLKELRLYDQFLEAFLDRAYDDIEAYSRKPPLLKGPSRILKKLRSMRIDLTKISEELTNIMKFFADWHLARIYMACKDRFHFKEWEDSLEGMLRTLDNLYNLVLTDINNRRLILLEIGIILLFIIDLILIGFSLR